jgi:hypothetical protein
VAPLDVQNPPQIPQHSCSNGKESEQANHLAAERASQAETRRKQPRPPCFGELATTDAQIFIRRSATPAMNRTSLTDIVADET